MSTRKDQHLAFALAQHTHTQTDFDYVQLVHHALPQQTYTNINLAVQLSNTLQLSTPFYINAMTGGSQQTATINEQLAHIAKETNLAIATGSLSVALKDTDLLDSFKIVRKINPHGLIFANLGAHHSLDNAKKAIDALQADALQLHLNAPQEIAMPEGDRDFSNWLENIHTIVTQLDTPVIVKETGFGMSQQTIQLLEQAGVSLIDVGGKGGTNFINIENARQTDKDYSFLKNWGQSTVISLLEARKAKQASTTLLASGGIQNPLDILKALCLGASAVGVAGYILHQLHTTGLNKTITTLQTWQVQLNELALLLGKTSVADLQTADFVLSGHVRDWAIDRQLY